MKLTKNLNFVNGKVLKQNQAIFCANVQLCGVLNILELIWKGLNSQIFFIKE